MSRESEGQVFGGRIQSESFGAPDERTRQLKKAGAVDVGRGENHVSEVMEVFEDRRDDAVARAVRDDVDGALGRAEDRAQKFLEMWRGRFDRCGVGKIEHWIPFGRPAEKCGAARETQIARDLRRAAHCIIECDVVAVYEQEDVALRDLFR